MVAKERDTQAERKGFQSKEAAKEAEDAKLEVAEEKAPEKVEPAVVPTSAKTGDGTRIVVNDPAEENRMVKVRPLRTIPRTRIGKDWYSFQQGKTCLVPKHVARLLEQKGVI